MTISIQAENDIHYAQEETVRFSKQIGFSDLDCTKIRIVISELSYNMLKYASRGFIRFSKVEVLNKKGIFIEAIDKGQGINDLDKALTDSYSTGGTLGLGLPGIKRMADVFEIHSDKKSGTHIKVKYWIKN